MEYSKKNIIGQIFFALSILMLVYMLINPLNHMIFNIDEYFTLTVINFPISDLLHIVGGDVHPPLYYLIAKLIAKLGTNLSILKIFSIIPYAIILIISTFKLREEYGWFTAGLFALALAIASEFFAKYLLLRPYSWAILFVVLSFIYFKDIITKDDKKSYVLFTIFSVLGSYFHYYAILTAICLYLMLIIHTVQHKGNKIKDIAIMVVASIILYAPWIPSFINFLQAIHKSFWIPFPTEDSIIQSLAYFAYSGDTLFSIITIIILVLIGLIYYKYANRDDDYYILSGIIAYFGTIILALIVSIIFKPILLARCLLPASAILWLAISIMIGKIESKRMFLIATAFIVLVLISGAALMITTSATDYQNGIAQQDVLNNITQDNNSVVIITSPNMVMSFLEYSNYCDMYCLNQSYVYGENMARTHEIFNFKDINLEDIDDFAMNNTDKNIYLISWGEPNANVTTVPLLKENNLIISKVNITNPYPDEIYGY
ncbi:MAG: glycosyltransferase family 39 protein [Methanobrevibacter sp.]|nr:glycosyltransferase family 39 protein [Methanobrevibacter sp.]